MSNTVCVSETIRSIPDATYASNPLGGFLVTGNNSTTGPPLNTDADYQYLCLTCLVERPRNFRAPAECGGISGAGTQHVQPPAGAQ